jgi:hypothetical protein
VFLFAWGLDLVNAGRHWGLGARYAFHAMRLCVGVRGVSRFVGIEQNSNL